MSSLITCRCGRYTYVNTNVRVSPFSSRRAQLAQARALSRYLPAGWRIRAWDFKVFCPGCWLNMGGV